MLLIKKQSTHHGSLGEKGEPLKASEFEVYWYGFKGYMDWINSDYNQSISTMLTP